MHIQSRKSQTKLGHIYFWTATIHEWFHLLEEDERKIIILNYIKNLSNAGLITVYAFVIMPNHMHLIWRQNKLNGKEMPKASLLKYTAHLFLLQLKAKDIADPYEVNHANKSHQIWRRDSLAIDIYSREAAAQKLEYIHANPVTGKWMLAKDDLHYYYSSARFYESGIDEFGCLNDIFEMF